MQGRSTYNYSGTSHAGHELLRQVGAGHDVRVDDLLRVLLEVEGVHVEHADVVNQDPDVAPLVELLDEGSISESVSRTEVELLEAHLDSIFELKVLRALRELDLESGEEDKVQALLREGFSDGEAKPTGGSGDYDPAVSISVLERLFGENGVEAPSEGRAEGSEKCECGVYGWRERYSRESRVLVF